MKMKNPSNPPLTLEVCKSLACHSLLQFLTCIFLGQYILTQYIYFFKNFSMVSVVSLMNRIDAIDYVPPFLTRYLDLESIKSLFFASSIMLISLFLISISGFL